MAALLEKKKSKTIPKIWNFLPVSSGAYVFDFILRHECGTNSSLKKKKKLYFFG